MARHRPHDELTDRLTLAMQRLIANSVLRNEQIARAVGLNVVDLQTLGVISRSPTPMTPGEVAKATLLPSSSTTRVLDRLEERGFITRAHDPVDRRRVLVAAVPARLAELAPHYEPIVARLRRIHEAYTADELAVVARYFEEIADL
jgi:DNA-binding MarR family transcriptional regulator